MAEIVNDLNHENNFQKILNGPAILIVKVDKKYLENPAKLKPELDNLLPNIQILQVKTTLNNNLIINFPDNENLNNFMKNEVIFVNNNKIILDKERKIKKIKFEIIIKGLSHEVSQEFIDEIEKAGIEKISRFSNRDNYKMIKGECKNKEVMNELIKKGLFINYCKFKVEKYLSPIKPIQCFKCQKFGHYSSACVQTSLICVKCTGNHRISECKSDKLKCANCSLEHTSSFGGCKIYQQNLKEKVEKIKNKNEKTNNVRQYSQVVENSHSTNNTIQALINSVDQLSNKIGVLESKFVENIENLVKNKIHEILEENIKQLIEIKYDEVNKAKMEEVVNFKINNYVKDKTSELNNTSNKINNYMKACDNNISVIKSRFIYVQIDMIKLWYPNQQPSDEQLKYYIDSISRHYNLKLDFNIIKEYVQKIYV
jgi:hypothetical protein